MKQIFHEVLNQYQISKVIKGKQQRNTYEQRPKILNQTLESTVQECRMELYTVAK